LLPTFGRSLGPVKRQSGRREPDKDLPMTTRKAEAEMAAEPGGSRAVIEELRRRFDRLTQSQKRIAEYIVEHAESVAFSTVDQMAARLDVNPSTIVRFAYRLGLNGFPDLQERMREIVRGQLSRTSEPDSESPVARHLEGTSFGASLSHDWQNLHRTISGLDGDTFARAVSTLARAKRAYVIAGFSTFPVASYFALILDRLRSDVSLLASNDAFSVPRLIEMKSDDCVVAFTFPRYASATHRIALWAKENKAKVIAVTDSPISAVGQIADVVLLAAAAGTGLQNSMVAPMAVANALLNGVAAAKGTSALERYNRHGRLMSRWDSFLLKTDGAGSGTDS
jgi:DNA-binding MurR/RpiR family transcriptional regulator